jgi:hypothetical protein
MSRASRAALFAIAALTAIAMATTAQASQRGPELKLVVPDSVEPGEDAYIKTSVFNTTDQRFAGPLTLTWTVSGDAEVISGKEFENSRAEIESSECGPPGSTQTCTIALTSQGLPSGFAIHQVDEERRLAVSPTASGEIEISAHLSMPGVPPTEVVRTLKVGPPLPYGIAEWKVPVFASDESQQLQAGSTPVRIENRLRFVSFSRQFVGRRAIGLKESIKDAVVHLPPGLIGNPQAAPYCSFVDLVRGGCPRDSQVGIFKGVLGTTVLIEPLYNIEPAPGEPARFGFVFAAVPTVLDASLRQGDYGVDVSSTNVNTTLSVSTPEFEFWGVPGDPRYDGMRGVCLYGHGGHGGGSGQSCPASIGRTSFLRLPTHCTGEPLRFPIEMNSWERRDLVHKASSEASSVGECENVPFGPKLTTVPSSLEAESPTGLSATVEVPNENLGNPDAISDSDIKSARVALPQGVTLNPSQAEGLGVCTEAELESSELSFHPDGTKGCPSDSKIGTVSVKTPVLEEAIPGNVYVAEPYNNPFDSLLAIYVVLEEPMRGILVKLAGKVEPDERTGRIVTTFSDLPQLPVSSFEFKFREGARAPLVTPPTCGTYTTEAQFTPWADPSETVVSESSFQITKGIGGGPCPSGAPAFKPGFSAGSVNNNAGSFSEFLMRLTRLDGEQDMTRFSATLPPGVVAKLAGVGKCPQAAIDAAEAKTGLDERANPSCPASSQIGRTLVGAGVGSVLTHVPGRLYLAGPYKGAPLSVAAITPAVAGPFDVGTVVVQEALTLDPVTAEVHVDGERSEPIPHILKGIPLKLRDLRVYVDRKRFTLNPTSCDPSSVKATLFGSSIDVFNAADDVPVALQARYQAANCRNLGFKPRLALKLKGGTNRGAHPALRAVFRPRPGDANLQRAMVKLPGSAFLDQAHIRTICTRVQWARDACPKGAIYGKVKAFTPLLEEPLKGNAYLRSSNNKLPDLVFDLKGVVDIETSARIDSVKGAIRATFPFVPDAPLTKVIVEMQGAKKGLIVNSANLCAVKSRANVKLEGHNDKAAGSRPVVKARCGKKARGGKRAR